MRAAIEACLSRTLLARCVRNGSYFSPCYFARDDLDMLTARTGLSEERLERWVEAFRESTRIDLREAALLRAQLRAALRRPRRRQAGRLRLALSDAYARVARLETWVERLLDRVLLRG